MRRKNQAGQPISQFATVVGFLQEELVCNYVGLEKSEPAHAGHEKRQRAQGNSDGHTKRYRDSPTFRPKTHGRWDVSRLGVRQPGPQASKQKQARRPLAVRGNCRNPRQPQGSPHVRARESDFGCIPVRYGVSDRGQSSPYRRCGFSPIGGGRLIVQPGREDSATWHAVTASWYGCCFDHSASWTHDGSVCHRCASVSTVRTDAYPSGSTINAIRPPHGWQGRTPVTAYRTRPQLA